MQLRSYQDAVITDLDRVIAAGKHRVILVSPTGSGKTIIAAEIIKQNPFKTILVLAHRREIISQTSQKLHAHGINHGIIQAGFENLLRPQERVQVASIQTLYVRAISNNRMDLPPAGIVIIDECHHATADTYRKIIAAYPDAILIGLTATPCRGDGRGLGGIFETIIECPQVAELIEQKYLVPTKVYAPVNPDLKGVEIRKGDYVESQLAERMDRTDLVGDIVTNYLKHGEQRKAVCFAINVQHSIHIRDEFIKCGVRAEHIDASTPKPERDAALARLASGELDLITNCMVLTEGWDMPEVSCCILARPTKKMGLYRQMIGRVLRPADGKINAIVIDHSGAVFRHGFAEDRVEWTLDPEKKSESRAHKARLADGYSSRMLDCSQCGAIRIAGEACKHRGFLPQRPPKAIMFCDGDLGAVDRSGRVTVSPEDRQRWHGMLTHIRLQNCHKHGWIAHKYKEKFGMWPPYGFTSAPIEPTPEVLSWVRSRNIAFAKGRGRAA